LQSSSTPFSTLLARFRVSYPTGSLISEFLTVHNGIYAVRALVQVGGTILATGMAAHANLETAEDQAKTRALEALGLLPTAQPTYSLPQWDANLLAPPPIAPPTKPPSPPPSLDDAAPLPQSQLPIAKPQLELVREIVTAPTAPEPAVEKAPELPPEDADKGIKPKKTKAEDAAPPEETQDRSDEIARIGVEMKRLGWTTIQGRDYLKQRYGKRSRQELNDPELLDFLAYLESQPIPPQ
jgi:hypothetical protein